MKENSRSRLLHLLTEACELEHGLCCSYLYTAFSMRTEIEEGLSWEQQQQNRYWASQIYHIAAQEMLHLAQAWNIMLSIGGSPHIDRPYFPLPAKFFPLNVSLTLRKFDINTIKRFQYYEKPSNKNGTGILPIELEAWPIDDEFEFNTVGDLYKEIANIINSSNENELFINYIDSQVTQKEIDFYDIKLVNNKETAISAIKTITEQGEGIDDDREDSHFGLFKKIEKELLNNKYSQSFPVCDNPYIERKKNYWDKMISSSLGIRRTLISNDCSVLAIDLFDDIYSLMLQVLAYTFNNANQKTDSLVNFSRSSIELMTTVIKPLGEAICRLPSGENSLNAGPVFGINKILNLPNNPKMALVLYLEKLEELSKNSLTLNNILDTKGYDCIRIKSVHHNLKRIIKKLKNHE